MANISKFYRGQEKKLIGKVNFEFLIPIRLYIKYYLSALLPIKVN